MTVPLSWAQLVDVGLSHVDQLSIGDHVAYWILRAGDDSALVLVTWDTDREAFHVRAFADPVHPAGGTSTMRAWGYEWSSLYTDVSALLADLAALVG